MAWHPSRTDLALYRPGDLPRWKRYFVGQHLRRCGTCSQYADSYLETAEELSELGGQQLEAPPWLAARILAAAAELPSPMTFSALAVRAAAVFVLIVLGLLLVGQRSPLRPMLSYQASATPDAVVEESAGPFGQQRVVFYTGVRGGVVDVSATPGGIGVSQADPATGAVTITRIAVR